jgi:hypothetical protein
LTEHFTLIGGLAFLDDDVSQLGLRGLPLNLCGALGPFRFFYGQ